MLNLYEKYPDMLLHGYRLIFVLTSRRTIRYEEWPLQFFADIP